MVCCIACLVCFAFRRWRRRGHKGGLKDFLNDGVRSLSQRRSRRSLRYSERDSRDSSYHNDYHGHHYRHSRYSRGPRFSRGEGVAGYWHIMRERAADTMAALRPSKRHAVHTHVPPVHMLLPKAKHHIYLSFRPSAEATSSSSSSSNNGSTRSGNAVAASDSAVAADGEIAHAMAAALQAKGLSLWWQKETAESDMRTATQANAAAEQQQMMMGTRGEAIEAGSIDTTTTGGGSGGTYRPSAIAEGAASSAAHPSAAEKARESRWYLRWSHRSQRNRRISNGNVAPLRKALERPSSHAELYGDDDESGSPLEAAPLASPPSSPPEPPDIASEERETFLDGLARFTKALTARGETPTESRTATNAGPGVIPLSSLAAVGESLDQPPSGARHHRTHATHSNGAGTTTDSDAAAPSLGFSGNDPVADGLLRCAIYVPIITRTALEPLSTLQPATSISEPLGTTATSSATSSTDRLLVEFRTAISLLKAGKLQCIFPILVGPPENFGSLGPGYADFHASGGVPECPDEMIEPVEAEVVLHLRAAGLDEASIQELLPPEHRHTSPATASSVTFASLVTDAVATGNTVPRTVRRAVAAIVDQPGFKLRGVKSDAVDHAVDEILLKAVGALVTDPHAELVAQERKFTSEDRFSRACGFQSQSFARHHRRSSGLESINGTTEGRPSIGNGGKAMPVRARRGDRNRHGGNQASSRRGNVERIPHARRERKSAHEEHVAGTREAPPTRRLRPPAKKSVDGPGDVVGASGAEGGGEACRDGAETPPLRVSCRVSHGVSHRLSRVMKGLPMVKPTAKNRWRMSLDAALTAAEAQQAEEDAKAEVAKLMAAVAAAKAKSSKAHVAAEAAAAMAVAAAAAASAEDQHDLQKRKASEAGGTAPSNDRSDEDAQQARIMLSVVPPSPPAPKSFQGNAKGNPFPAPVTEVPVQRNSHDADTGGKDGEDDELIMC